MSPVNTMSHLRQLEAEAIYIMREVVAEFERPCMFYSIGKDSTVMLHLARKAFAPGRIPFPLLHVDTTWEFHEMASFRDRIAEQYDLDIRVHVNREALAAGVDPFTSGSVKYTDQMKTVALKQALDQYGFDACFGGGRRDEEKSRAKERVFSFRDRQHQWDPKNQRPELWQTYNGRINKGESIRVFPLSNWTEQSARCAVDRAAPSGRQAGEGAHLPCMSRNMADGRKPHAARLSAQGAQAHPAMETNTRLVQRPAGA